MKAVKPSTTATTAQSIRTGQAQISQASARNKRLAEQMSRRGTPTVPEPTPTPAAGNIKNRLGLSTVSTKSRLGQAPRGASNRSPGFTGGRGRGQMGASASRGFVARGRLPQRGGAQRGGAQRGGAQRGQGFSSRGIRGAGRGRQSVGRGSTRSRGRGARGGGAGSQVSRQDLDSQLDSYMNVGKKSDVAENWD